MKHLVTFPTLTIALFVGITGCGAETGNTQPGSSSQNEFRMTSNEISKRSNSQGRNFQTLDEYLAYLKELGAQDYPFYELVGPNRHKLNIGRGGNEVPAKYFTRDDLMKKFSL